MQIYLVIKGADTLGHIAEKMNGLNMPNLAKLGLGNIREIKGIEKAEQPLAYYTKMKEASNGKRYDDWTLGNHGLEYSNSISSISQWFPEELLVNELEAKTGREIIGNIPASGTEILMRLGEEHMKTGALIVYTSADSVLQIAAHEDIVPLEELYKICEIARELTLADEFMVGRVIARPFIGEPGNFKRTPNRHDYALKPFDRTVMDELKDSGL